MAISTPESWQVDNLRLAVVGLGYVGLPLAAAFGKEYPTLGFDINEERIGELKRGHDRTLECDEAELKGAGKLEFSADLEALRNANFYIITVPTPIDANKRPDLGPLRAASTTVGKVLSPGDIVVYESTVYPGATEEVCVPILEQLSGLKLNQDFHAGYSPERINPGDKEHRLPDITKITAGSTPEAAEWIDKVYRLVIRAGTHRASSIRVAEAAKVIENTQRDVNIALINELALIFERLDIDTLEVLKAAGTKWNFLPFRPGLVGGHCIGVDPYYLTHKAQEIGHHPEIILAGRRINDGMAAHVVQRVSKLLSRQKVALGAANVLILGLTFKENCPDLRNTRVTDIIEELAGYGSNVDVWDPWVDAEEARQEYGLELVEKPAPGHYDAVILAVAHDQFVELGADGVRAFCSDRGVIFDVKSLFPTDAGIVRL